MSIAEHALFASPEDKENARENLIALQKQLQDEDKKKTAIKWVGGIGVVGLLAWWIFGKRGDGGGNKDGGTPYDGSAGNIEVVLIDGPTFRVNATQAKYTTPQLIALAKQQNATVHIMVAGSTISKYYDQARTLIAQSGIKAMWNDPSVYIAPRQ